MFAGATVEQTGVLLAGMAGLLAGALSMSLGEWISVKSSQELYENPDAQLEMEKKLDNSPETEQRTHPDLWQRIPEDQAKMAADIIQNKMRAHEVLVREELGINTSEELKKGSAPWKRPFPACLFRWRYHFLGRYGICRLTTAILLSVVSSAAGLFPDRHHFIHGKMYGIPGLSRYYLVFTAAAVTFGIGKLIGASVA